MQSKQKKKITEHKFHAKKDRRKERDPLHFFTLN